MDPCRGQQDWLLHITPSSNWNSSALRNPQRWNHTQLKRRHCSWRKDEILHTKNKNKTSDAVLLHKEHWLYCTCCCCLITTVWMSLYWPKTAADTWISLKMPPTLTLPLQHFEKIKLHSHVVVVLVCVSQNCASQCQDNSCILSTQNKELSSLQDRLSLKSKTAIQHKWDERDDFSCP